MRGLLQGIWRRGRTRWAVLSLALVVLAAGAAVARSVARGDQLSQNRAQLKEACQGLLPQERLRRHLPEDAAGTAEEYGTLLDPDQESRALLDCRLSWGGAARVWVRAEALGERRFQTPADDASEIAGYAVEDERGGGSEGRFPFRLPASATGTVQRGEVRGGTSAVASLLVSCPKGLKGRTGATRDLQVAVGLPVEGRLSEEDRMLAARTAVSYANWITSRQRCGTPRLPVDAPAPQPAKALCAWLDPKELGLAAGRWTRSAARPYSDWSGRCSARRDDEATPRRLAITAVRAKSLAGVLGREQSRARRALEGGPDTAADGSRTVIGAGDPYTFDLWAQSTCDGGRVYHHVALTPELVYDEQKSAVLSKADVDTLSAGARTVMERYLAAADGWPATSHCRGAKMLEDAR
ncbi:hypothetical protein AB0M39_00610 [Streptomyces sp. NPDC051907]|uniref:hypothetical protein n=1 Tax=Streptomyces sp. NPDC051907 TaxID=3155284 RepID=UPI003440C18D